MLHIHTHLNLNDCQFVRDSRTRSTSARLSARPAIHHPTEMRKRSLAECPNVCLRVHIRRFMLIIMIQYISDCVRQLVSCRLPNRACFQAHSIRFSCTSTSRGPTPRTVTVYCVCTSHSIMRAVAISLILTLHVHQIHAHYYVYYTTRYPYNNIPTHTHASNGRTFARARRHATVCLSYLPYYIQSY